MKVGMMNRTEVLARQSAGDRVEVFDEPCAWCGRPSVYHRDQDRYRHRDGAPDLACWVALSQGGDTQQVADRVGPVPLRTAG